MQAFLPMRGSMGQLYIYSIDPIENQPFMESLNIPFVPWIRHMGYEQKSGGHRDRRGHGLNPTVDGWNLAPPWMYETL